MAWCPECETEYKNDLLECPYCGSKLVGDLLETTAGRRKESPEPNFGNDSANQKKPIIPRLLISAPEIIRANLVESLLTEAGIPFFAKDSRNSGVYIKAYTGNTFYGEDIYVDSSDFDKAKELIDGYLEGVEEKEMEPIPATIPIAENEKRPSSVFRSVMRLLVAILLVIIGIALLYEAVTLLIKISQ